MLLPAVLQWTHATGAWVNTPCVKANRASGMLCQGRLGRRRRGLRCTIAQHLLAMGCCTMHQGPRGAEPVVVCIIMLGMLVLTA
jgi:hypothetical protein